MKSKMIALTLLLFCSTWAYAGEHVNEKDEFTEEYRSYFGPTLKEVEATNAMYMIRGYDEESNTVGFVVGPVSGATECNSRYLLLKDSNGVIHKIDAEERNNRMCVVRYLDADLVKKPFKVRIPMFRGSDLDIDVDTTNLDLSKLQQ